METLIGKKDEIFVLADGKTTGRAKLVEAKRGDFVGEVILGVKRVGVELPLPFHFSSIPPYSSTIPDRTLSQ